MGIRSSLPLLRLLWPNSLRQGAVSISQYALSYSPVLLSSVFLSLGAVAAVGLSVQVVGLVKVFGNVLFNAYLPSFANLRMSMETGKLRQRFALSLGVANASLLAFGFGAFALGNWVLTALGSDVLLVALIPGLVLLLGEVLINQSALTTGFIATANVVPMVWSYVLTALGAIAGQFLFAGVLGLGEAGVFAGPLVACAVFHGWYWWLRAARDLHWSGLQLWWDSLSEPISGFRGRF